MPTDLNSMRWIHGSPDCAHSTDPPIQVVAYDEDTFVLRQSKCVDFEAPFLYLLFGDDAVLLHDSGATASPRRFPIRRVVDEIVAHWLGSRGTEKIRRIVTHSHGHRDHTAGDGQFADLPPHSIAPTGVEEVAAFFGIADWPRGRSALDLGGRILDILPAPGHFEDHVVLFDRSRGCLLTGDSLYPGLLVVHDWSAYQQSIQRIAQFCREVARNGSPVTHVLGAHIEMTNQPGQLFEIGATFQPDEHPLTLLAEHVFSLHDELSAAGNRPRRIAYRDFIVEPSTRPEAALVT